jgi:hypothetical protein
MKETKTSCLFQNLRDGIDCKDKEEGDKQDSEDTKVSHYRQFDSKLITVLTSSLYIVGLVPMLIASSMMRMFGRRAS